MRVLITGGRSFEKRSLLTEALDRLHQERGITTLIHGAAKGADRLAGEWAESRGIEVIANPAEWRRYGRAAGPIRNKQMLAEHKPDVVVAFPGSTGTANMVSIAEKAGVEVVRINATDPAGQSAAQISGQSTTGPKRRSQRATQICVARCVSRRSSELRTQIDCRERPVLADGLL